MHTHTHLQTHTRTNTKAHTHAHATHKHCSEKKKNKQERSVIPMTLEAGNFPSPPIPPLTFCTPLPPCLFAVIFSTQCVCLVRVYVWCVFVCAHACVCIC